MCDDSCQHQKEDKKTIETNPKTIQSNDYMVNGIKIGHTDNLVGHNNLVLLSNDEFKLKWDTRDPGLYVQCKYSTKRDKMVTQSQLLDEVDKMIIGKNYVTKYNLDETNEVMKNMIRKQQKIKENLNELREEFIELRHELREDVNNLTKSLNETREQLQAVIDFCFTDRSGWKEGQK